jgi:hypothetical protein
MYNIYKINLIINSLRFQCYLKMLNSFNILYCSTLVMDQGEPGLDYNDSNLNPLICDLCKQTFDSLDKLGEHQKQKHNMP